MKISSITFYENPSSWSRANTYGQTDMKLVGTFRGYANASETQVRISSLLHRESERQREKVFDSVLLNGNVQSNLSNSKQKGPPKRIELSKNSNYESYVVSI